MCPNLLAKGIAFCFLLISVVWAQDYSMSPAGTFYRYLSEYDQESSTFSSFFYISTHKAWYSVEFDMSFGINPDLELRTGDSLILFYEPSLSSATTYYVLFYEIAGSGAGPMPPPMSVLPYTIKALVMVLSFCGSPSASMEVLEDVLFENATSNNPSLQAYFENCTYGNVIFNNQSTTIVQVPMNCSGTSPLGTPWSSETCAFPDMMGWQETAEAYVTNVLKLPLSNYRHHIFILPTNSPPCDWQSYSSFGCDASACRAFLPMPPSPSTQLLAALYDSIGANYGVQPSSYASVVPLPNMTTGWASGPNACTAGGQDCGTVCYDPPSSWMINVAKPAASLNGSNFPIGAWMNVSLPVYSTAAANMIRVAATWLPPPYSVHYVALRAPVGYDSGFAPNAGAVIVVYNYNGSQYNTYVENFTLVTEMRPGTEWWNEDSQWVIVTSNTTSDVSMANVHICRYEVYSDCSFPGLDDPIPSPPPSLSPPPPSPLPPPVKLSPSPKPIKLPPSPSPYKPPPQKQPPKKPPPRTPVLPPPLMPPSPVRGSPRLSPPVNMPTPQDMPPKKPPSNAPVSNPALLSPSPAQASPQAPPPVKTPPPQVQPPKDPPARTPLQPPSKVPPPSARVSPNPSSPSSPVKPPYRPPTSPNPRPLPPHNKSPVVHMPPPSSHHPRMPPPLNPPHMLPPDAPAPHMPPPSSPLTHMPPPLSPLPHIPPPSSPLPHMPPPSQGPDPIQHPNVIPGPLVLLAPSPNTHHHKPKAQHPTPPPKSPKQIKPSHHKTPLQPAASLTPFTFPGLLDEPPSLFLNPPLSMDSALSPPPKHSPSPSSQNDSTSPVVKGSTPPLLKSPPVTVETPPPSGISSMNDTQSMPPSPSRKPSSPHPKKPAKKPKAAKSPPPPHKHSAHKKLKQG